MTTKDIAALLILFCALGAYIKLSKPVIITNIATCNGQKSVDEYPLDEGIETKMRREYF